MGKIKICSIKQDFYDMFSDDVELEKNDKRPCLIILKLSYKGKKYNFAVPFRSNINKYASRAEYYPLPPRSTTKQNRKHGLHYIKMFPIKKEYIKGYYHDNAENSNDIKKITKNFQHIIEEAQEYLTNYENGTRYKFCVDLDTVIDVEFKSNGENEAAATYTTRSR